MMEGNAFLTAFDITLLTGVKTGRSGQTREQLQCMQLRAMAVAFRTNVRGAPVVTWGAVNGVNQPLVTSAWQPNILMKAA